MNAAEDHGVTALARAVENTSLAMVETLIAAGADVNAAQVSGLAPLMTAAETPTWSGRSSHMGRTSTPPRPRPGPRRTHGLAPAVAREGPPYAQSIREKNPPMSHKRRFFEPHVHAHVTAVVL